MKRTNLISIIVICLTTSLIVAQDKTTDYLNMKWKHVATRMPAQWYGSEEAKLVADNILLSQKKIGGWEKNKTFHKPFSKEERDYYIKNKSEIGGTFDNGATITELQFLAKMYSQNKNKRYKEAFENGLNYIFISQYKNGGWPQFFPVKKAKKEIALDKTEPYSMHITYNDNAMVNIMKFLKDIMLDSKEYVTFQLNQNIKTKVKMAFNKGIACFLKTQIVIDNKPTVWCAQHNKETLLPAKARSYELPSFSGSESVGIVIMLMDIEKPSKDIIDAVNGAVEWFENHKIEGIKVIREIQEDGRKNRIVVKDKNAPKLWGRFNDLETGEIFFCSRDGIKKDALSKISYERRNGYSWYTNAPKKVLDRYPEWKKINHN
tara:strand:+ start:22092 stop:23219 length:1128 start_codon:yes stop_codon:yes gene_type:complete